MKCYECRWLDRSVILTSIPPQYRCTLGFGSHYADHECEYDFMPIVRCKECRWWNGSQETMHNNHLCRNWSKFGSINTSADDYCSYGEREKSEAEE